MSENRRNFLKRATAVTAAIPFLNSCAVAQKSTNELDLIKSNAILTDGQWNGAKDAPQNVSWRTGLAKDSDHGQQMIISGTVFEADGQTPAPSVLIYLYHTDIYGLYGKSGEHRHGHYRGWMLTDLQGRYEFQTIKPAPYPENRFAAHIHTTITTKDLKEDWIDNYLFEGDTLISVRERETAGRKGGFNPIVKLEKGKQGIWLAKRDIKLWQAS